MHAWLRHLSAARAVRRARASCACADTRRAEVAPGAEPPGTARLRSPLGVNGIAIRLAVACERRQVIVNFQHVHPGVTKPAARRGNGSIKRGAGGACAAFEVAVRT